MPPLNMNAIESNAVTEAGIVVTPEQPLVVVILVPPFATVKVPPVEHA
jgi:hypothetical protein